MSGASERLEIPTYMGSFDPLRITRRVAVVLLREDWSATGEK